MNKNIFAILILIYLNQCFASENLKVLGLTNCGADSKKTLCIFGEYPQEKITLVDLESGNVCHIKTDQVIKYVRFQHDDTPIELSPKAVTEISDRQKCQKRSLYRAFLGELEISFKKNPGITLDGPRKEEITKAFNLPDFMEKNKIHDSESAKISIKEILDYDNKFQIIHASSLSGSNLESFLVLHRNGKFEMLAPLCAILHSVSLFNKAYMIDVSNRKCETCDTGIYTTYLFDEKLTIVSKTGVWLEEH